MTQSAENGAPACACPTDDYCPKCHPRWHAKWVRAAADEPCRECGGRGLVWENDEGGGHPIHCPRGCDIPPEAP